MTLLSRHAIEQYVAEARAILNNLLDALAEALLLERHAFLQNFDPNESEINVRVNYYPPCPRPDLALGILMPAPLPSSCNSTQGCRRPPSVERHEMGQCDLATRGIAGECGRFARDHEQWEVEEPMA